MLSGDELKQATHKFAAETREKIVQRQAGVPTFCDNIFLALVDQLNQLDKDRPWEESLEHLEGTSAAQLKDGLFHLRHFLSRRSPRRFVDYQERFIETPEGPKSESAISFHELILSQGVSECMQWKGQPLFKTVFDFSIYSMLLWELKPRTIIELGSGSGSSAVWMADLMRAFALPAHVYSVDVKKVALEYEGVSFIQGNCWAIERVFTKEFLNEASHPWLFIEDAHANVYGVLSHFHAYFQAGDYVIVEDSIAKQDVLAKFTNQHPGLYQLDTYYTDFFGRNATCAHDSIFVRTRSA
jgi:cephalosporin hydroxylase